MGTDTCPPLRIIDSDHELLVDTSIVTDAPKKAPPSLGDCACFTARNAARAITDLYDQTLAPSGLRINQFATLAAIHQRQGGSMQTVAADLGLDPSTMTRVLRPLVDDGLVKVEPGPNRRAKQLALTERGQRKLRDTHGLWERAQNDLREKLGPGIFDRLVGDLTSLHDALRP